MKLFDIGKQANALEDEIGINIDDVLNKLTQELGEFNDAVQKYRGRYCKQRAANLEAVQGEVGDVYFNLISICHRLGLDVDKLSEYAEVTLHKFEERKPLYLHSQKMPGVKL